MPVVGVSLWWFHSNSQSFQDGSNEYNRESKSGITANMQECPIEETKNLPQKGNQES